MTHPFTHITSTCFVNVPFLRLEKDLKLIIDNRIQPEIGLEGDILYTGTRQQFSGIAKALKSEGLACTLHAPFSDISPGALDPYIIEATRNKLRKAFALIELFEPVTIVCHLNYEAYKHRYRLESWMDQSLHTWRDLLALVESHATLVTFENTYETEPDIHRHILESLSSPQARFCLDVGHLTAFARTSWPQWLPALSPWLSQLHLHDNHGHYDEHLAVGQGSFDFAGLFNYLTTENLHPVITLEPHLEEDLWASLKALAELNYFSAKR